MQGANVKDGCVYLLVVVVEEPVLLLVLLGIETLHRFYPIARLSLNEPGNVGVNTDRKAVSKSLL